MIIGGGHGMNKKADTTKNLHALYEAVASLRDADECRRFFDDMCTESEIKSMKKRFDVAVLLMQNKVYLDILSQTGASTAIISRVRRNILNNNEGGAMREVIIRQGLVDQKYPTED